MSSLQALLDAQEQRRGSSSSGRGGGGRNHRNSRSSGSGDQPSRGYPDGDARRGSWQPSSQQREWRNGHGGSRNTQSPHGRWDNFSSHEHDRNVRSSKASSEPTYEERRASIERRAIQDSRKFHNRRNGSSKEDDIDSVLSWVGPLVDGESCTYYQDRDKRYPFYTDERGYALLQQLMNTNKALLQLNHKMLEERAAAESNNNGECDAKDVIIRIGQGLYAHKPTLRTKGVTWSTEEYSHPGLQRMYLRMKSIQRFTEVWCLLERSAALGVFAQVFDNPPSVLRIAAVGGGPGYELLATKLFFAEHAPEIKLELISMDLCPAWRPYVEQLGFRFVEYDVNNERGDDPIQAAGLEPGDLHFCIVSCLMIYCTNKTVLNMFRKLVHEDGVNAMLVSERGERTMACTMMEDLGGKVIRLIDQSNGMDERQAIWCSDEFCNERLRSGTFSSEDYEAHQTESVFPNVPYCEHKERRAGRSGQAR